MAHSTDPNHPAAVIDRLCRATNAHDLDALTACFAADYRNDTPAHPARSFRGQAQVRRNWQRIFAVVPDITASVRWVAQGSTVWSEWEMRGTRLDGSSHHMLGVVLFGIAQGQASWARFYLEPVQHEGDGGIDAAVGAHVGLSHRADVADSRRSSSPA